MSVKIARATLIEPAYVEHVVRVFNEEGTSNSVPISLCICESSFSPAQIAKVVASGKCSKGHKIVVKREYA